MIKATGITTEDWEEIKLPALAHTNDPMGREVGEPLCAERHSLAKELAIKAVTLAYIYSATHDHNPVQKGGNYISIERFSTHPEAPANLRWIRFWDIAAEIKKTNDFTASPEVAFDEHGDLWIRTSSHTRRPHGEGDYQEYGNLGKAPDWIRGGRRV